MFENIDLQKRGIGTDNTYADNVDTPYGYAVSQSDHYWVEENIGKWVDPRREALQK